MRSLGGGLLVGLLLLIRLRREVTYQEHRRLLCPTAVFALATRVGGGLLIWRVVGDSLRR